MLFPGEQFEAMVQHLLRIAQMLDDVPERPAAIPEFPGHRLF